MMKKNILLPIISLLAICTVFPSCDSDGDTTKPVINLISPEEGAHLKIGDEKGIHFSAEFSDNEMLKSYSIEIHNNFDDHGHVTKADSEETGTEDFKINQSWDLSGHKNKSVHHHEIVIPANATPGKYHIVVYCLDASANESYVARNIVLTHDDTNEDKHDHDHDH